MIEGRTLGIHESTLTPRLSGAERLGRALLYCFPSSVPLGGLAVMTINGYVVSVPRLVGGALTLLGGSLLARSPGRLAGTARRWVVMFVAVSSISSIRWQFIEANTHRFHDG